MTIENKQARNISRREALSLLSATTAGIFGGILFSEARHSRLEEEKKVDTQELLPQGFWEVAEMRGTVLHAEVTAYFNHPNLAIQEVDITIQDKNGDWITVCPLEKATKTDTFVCSEDISDSIRNMETVIVGFNVFGTNGKVSKSPDNARVLKVE